MYISQVSIKNYRLLKDSTLTIDSKHKSLSILIGKNNSGKTSFINIIEHFLNQPSFNFYDFPLSTRNQVLKISEDTNVHDISIQLALEITYTQEDDLSNISDFLVDLAPDDFTANILFECSIKKKKLLSTVKDIETQENKERYIQKYLADFLDYKIYAFSSNDDLNSETRDNLIEKDKKQVNNLINCQVIHAKRNVSSSESNEGSNKILSKLATRYYNNQSENQLSQNELNQINEALLGMDKTLGSQYDSFFKNFLKNSINFLNLSDVKVVSDLQSKEVLSNHSKIIYGSEGNGLPEHLNGLGYMNILYLLLQLEIKKDLLVNDNKDINLLFIEEPEAHTHPQMQVVFIQQIKTVLSEIKNLQTLITTHSSHIVKNCNFKDIQYFQDENSTQNIDIKGFYKDLEEKYGDDKESFRFINQYLTIASAELFFAEKAIFIEGITEKFLLPHFIKKFDDENGFYREPNASEFNKLASQNISIIEAGANAKAFKHLLEFLGIKTLIITDIDTVKKTTSTNTDTDKQTTTYPSSSVNEGTHTSNATIKYFYNAPKVNSENWQQWFDNLKQNKLHQNDSIIKIAFQIEEDGYHGRSFEESFFKINIENFLMPIKPNNDDSALVVESIQGLKNKPKEQLQQESIDIDTVVNNILEKKSEFASSILWLALTEDVQWNIPKYIKEGLQWLAK